MPAVLRLRKQPTPAAKRPVRLRLLARSAVSHTERKIRVTTPAKHLGLQRKLPTPRYIAVAKRLSKQKRHTFGRMANAPSASMTVNTKAVQPPVLSLRNAKFVKAYTETTTRIITRQRRRGRRKMVNTIIFVNTAAIPTLTKRIVLVARQPVRLWRFAKPACRLTAY